MGCWQFLFPAAWPVLLLGVALQYIPLAQAASIGNSGAQGQSCDPSVVSTAEKGLQLEITPGQKQVVFNCGPEKNKAVLLPVNHATQCLHADCSQSSAQTLADVCTDGAQLTESAGEAMTVYTFSITPPATKECEVCYTCSIPPSGFGKKEAAGKTCNVKISVVTSSSTTKPTSGQPGSGASPGPSNQTPGTPAPQDSPGGGTAAGGDQQDSSSMSRTLGGSSLLAGVMLCLIHMPV